MVALPDISVEAQRFVPLPTAPSDPPTFADVTNAHRLVNLLLRAERERVVDAEEVVKGIVYREKIVATLAGGEPPWFAEAMARELQPVNDRIMAIENGLRELRSNQEQIQRITAITFNMQCCIGPDVQFEVVLFPNGEDPTKDPYNLPALSSPDVVRGLATPARNQYYRNYKPGNNLLPSAARQIDVILKAIGSNAYSY